MSEKVKLQKEVIEVIETMTATGAPLNEIVERHIHGVHLRVNGYGLIEQMSTDTLIRALYIGYEVESTLEEKVADYFEHCKKSASPEIRSEMYGIRNTLNILGIKIEGVNA